MVRSTSAGNGVVGSPGGQPFLTEAQRTLIDAAIAAKQQEVAESIKYQGGKNKHHDASKSKRDAAHDHHVTRKTATGKPRTDKKGGGGGKFTWGSALEPYDDEEVDPSDPSYVPEEEQEAIAPKPLSRGQQIQQYKKAVLDLLEEYLDSGDIEEAAQSLQELDMPQYDHWFVKRAVTLAMDKHDREREMTSMLLSALYSEVIHGDQIARGLHDVLDGLDDLVLDVPEAPELLATFIARAVVDDILPPSFVGRLAGTGSCAEVRAKCESHLGAPHAAERLLRCWGSGAGLVHTETKEAVNKIILELCTSGDQEEAVRCLQALAVPWFHHELVKQALHRAMDHPTDLQPLCKLLHYLSSTAVVSELQMTKGFQRVATQMADTALDVPHAQQAFTELLQRAQQEGWLTMEFGSSTEAPDGLVNGSGNGHSMKSFKVTVVSAIKEFFSSGDAEEVSRQLMEMNGVRLHHLVVKHAVTLALDRKDREREMMSTLLVSLYPKVISSEDMSLGFTTLLLAVDDLSLDILDAPHLLSLFLGRAVVDELLPPSFLTTCLPALKADSVALDVVKGTINMLGARHAAERLSSCWHGGAMTLTDLKAAMQQLLEEYVVTNDFAEASRCLLDLDVPHYTHEMVKRALIMACDKEAEDNCAATQKLLLLLKQLEASGAINPSQMRMGFERVEAQMDDIKLDCPKAPQLFQSYKQLAIGAGWLMVDA